MNSEERKKKFEVGLAHFNAEKFFEAHEFWEEIWLVESEPEKTFLQGLIQVAAAFTTSSAEILTVPNRSSHPVSSNSFAFPPTTMVSQSGSCAKPVGSGPERLEVKVKLKNCRFRALLASGIPARARNHLTKRNHRSALRVDDNLTFHSSVPGATFLATEK